MNSGLSLKKCDTMNRGPARMENQTVMNLYFDPLISLCPTCGSTPSISDGDPNRPHRTQGVAVCVCACVRVCARVLE